MTGQVRTSDLARMQTLKEMLLAKWGHIATDERPGAYRLWCYDPKGGIAGEYHSDGLADCYRQAVNDLDKDEKEAAIRRAVRDAKRHGFDCLIAGLEKAKVQNGQDDIVGDGDMAGPADARCSRA